MTRFDRFGNVTDPLEQELRDVLARHDPVPERVELRARAALCGKAPEDSDLLELVDDRILDRDLVVGDGDTPVRLLSFAGGIRLAVRADAEERGWSFTGWTAPVMPAAAALRTERSTIRLPLRADGAFSAQHLARTPVSILIEAHLRGVNRRFHSSWFAL